MCCSAELNTQLKSRGCTTQVLELRSEYANMSSERGVEPPPPDAKGFRSNVKRLRVTTVSKDNIRSCCSAKCLGSLPIRLNHAYAANPMRMI